MRVGFDLHAGGATIAGLQVVRGGLFAEKRFGQFQGEQSLAHAVGASEKISVREASTAHGAREAFHQDVMPANTLPCQVLSSLDSKHRLDFPTDRLKDPLLWLGLLTKPRAWTEGLHAPPAPNETFGRVPWPGWGPGPQLLTPCCGLVSLTKPRAWTEGLPRPTRTQ